MILVTGGHGFVGKALMGALRKNYHDTEIIAPTSKELDLLNSEKTLAFFHEHQIDCVFHLAARLGGVGLVSNKPLEFLESNLLINYNILRASLTSGVKKFITLGSSCSYSVDAPLPNRESDLWHGHPENTYGICKLVLLEHLISQTNMDWAYLIPPNIYGPGDHFGEKDAHFIPATVMKFQNALRENVDEIEVWGDGMQTRDFVYIDDMVYFLISAFENKEYSKKAVNVGTGIEVTIKEVVENIQSVMGLTGKVKINWAPDKPTGGKRKVFCNEALLQIEPNYRFVGIREGLERTLKNI